MRPFIIAIAAVRVELPKISRNPEIGSTEISRSIFVHKDAPAAIADPYFNG
jgi:hypothetical protein